MLQPWLSKMKTQGMYTDKGRLPAADKRIKIKMEIKTADRAIQLFQVTCFRGIKVIKTKARAVFLFCFFFTESCTFKI